MNTPSILSKITAKYILSFLSFCCVTEILKAQDFEIIAHSNNSVTTHKLSSGTSGFEIGITSNGGGVINFIGLPGTGDIMRLASDRYGRAGQLAFRDSSHGGSYNPTQAGYNEELGTKCEVIRDGKKLIIPQRGLALWFGDGRYDFSEWENIGSDSKDSDGGNSDVDGLDESNLPNRQSAEVLSEFDYYGTYEDVFNENGIDVSIIRHYFEASFIREPGHCINQFREGTSAFNEKALRRQITNMAPKGSFPGTDKDLNGVIAVWSLRNDVNRWDYKHVYLRNDSNEWKSFDAANNVPSTYDQSIIIMAESSDPNKGRALCLYKPNSEINNVPVVGIDERFGTISYKDDRIRLAAEGTQLTYEKFRTPSMSKYGFSNRFSGMINRTRLDENIYEMYRGEYYMIYGTPQEIMNNISKIKGIQISQNISFSELEEKKVNDADFYPSAFSDSRLPITYTSSNPNVAKIENGKVVMVGPGTTTIKATQAGSTLYKEAKPVSQTLVVKNTLINLPPEASFTTPENNSIIEEYSELILTVEASDPNGDSISVLLKIDGKDVRSESVAPYEWGHNGSPNPSETLGLNVGEHLIEAIITDDKGEATTISKTITVTAKNDPPTVSITFPVDGSEFEIGQNIDLKTEASDIDGNLDKVNFKIDDAFFKQDKTRPYATTFTPDKEGTYKIAARAFDKEGLTFETFVTITVVSPITLSSDSFINKNSLSNVKVYPSPATNFINVTGISNNTQVAIIDITGKTVLNRYVNKDNSKINISSLLKGVYFLKVYKNDTQKTITFIKS